jgi:outer membrane protein assembly complex protein YaeT
MGQRVSVAAIASAAFLAAWVGGCGVARAGSADQAGSSPPSVARFAIEGVRAVDEGALRAALQTQQRSRLPWRPPRTFDPDTFEADLQRIETFYAERGYPDARVVESDVRIDDARNEAFLRVRVDEGEPVRVAAIDYLGLEVLPQGQRERLRALAPLQPGDPLATGDVQATGALVLRALQEAGFAFARLEIGETVEAPRRVRLVLRADPGPRAIFGAVDIAGQRSVDDGIVRRHVVYLPGQPFQLRAVEETQRRLLDLGLFTDVRIETVGPDAPGPVRTRITVEEGDHRRWDLSVGYGSEAQVHADARISHVNFLGGARTATAAGRLSWRDRGMQGAFVQPYLFQRDLSLRIDGHLWFADERRYEVLSRGGRATVQYRRSTRLSGHASFLNEFTTTQLPGDALDDPALLPIVAPAIDPFTGRQRGLLSAVNIGASWNATEGVAEPERGYLLSATVEQAGGWLPGSFHYASVLGEVRAYASGAAGVMLAQRLRMGTIGPFGPASDVPFFRRYFLGGADSLRGWGLFEVAPLSPGGVPIGGRALLDSSSELRFPVGGGVRGVAFLDAGNVWPTAGTVRLRELRAAAGAGVRYASPFGPLRLDVGYQLTPIGGLRIDREPQARRWRIHVGVTPPF